MAPTAHLSQYSICRYQAPLESKYDFGIESIKLGLPGARTGIVIANPTVINAFAKANTILNLGLRQHVALAKHLLVDGKILKLSREIVAPFYRDKMENAVRIFKHPPGQLPYRIHKPEGAIFLAVV